MTEYWLISAPAEKSRQQTWENLNTATGNLSVNYKFNVPELKVGTLDQLVSLTDELARLDVNADVLAKKIASYLGEVLEDQRDKLHENLQANRGDLPSYITHFQWDMAKYPLRQSLRNTTDTIIKQITQIDADLKAKATAYNNLKGALQNLEKKLAGSLLTRNLADIVKKEHFVLNSAYLVTLLVVVPIQSFNDWNNGYEKLNNMIVPNSTQFIGQDDEYGLFTVTLFKKVVDEFKVKAREKKFIVRDFTYNDETLASGRNELNRLLMDKKKLFGPLLRWLKISFGECFCALIHIKAIRVFVESVLRYGLPVNFQAMLLRPRKREAKRLRKILLNLYGNLDTSSVQRVDGETEIAGLTFTQSDYYPYVFFKIDINMVDSKLLPSMAFTSIT